MVISQHPIFSTGVIDYSFLKRILMYLAIAVLLCLLSDALTSRKEVFIRKMQGATSWFIYKRLYGKFYLLSILMFCVNTSFIISSCSSKIIDLLLMNSFNIYCSLLFFFFCTLSDCSWIYNICLIKSNSIGCYIEKNLSLDGFQ